MTKTYHTYLAIALSLLISACSSQSWTESATDKRNEVSLVRMSQDIHFASDSADLDDGEMNDLKAFLARTNIVYGDTVALDAGSASMMTERRAAIADILRAQGIRLSASDIMYGTAMDTDTMRLVVSRHVVTAPKCPDWSKPAGYDSQNTDHSNFGCASRTNLGLMVANPHDLVAGQNNNNPNSLKSSLAVDNLLNGTTKQTKSQSIGN